MAENLSGLLRRLQNIVRFGTIAEVDHDAPRCRMQSGALLTNWRPFFALRAGNVRTWCPPSIGEQCVMFSPGGDLAAGIVLVGAYSDQFDAPSNSPSLDLTEYPDGAVISYDHAAHALHVSLPSGGSVTVDAPGGNVTVNTAAATVNTNTALIAASESITHDSPITTCTGALIVQGPLTFQAGASGSPAAGGGPAFSLAGDMESTGEITTMGDVVAGSISLKTHLTTGVKHGTEVSGGPQ